MLKKALCFIAVVAMSYASGQQTAEVKRESHIYGKTGYIYSVDDVVTVCDANGNFWSFSEIEDWNEGDGCIVILNDMGTIENHDDEIIAVTYCNN